MKKKSEFSPQTIAVVGAGPVGCVLASFLSRGGYEVVLCDVIPDLVEPALRAGICIEGAETLKQSVSKICTSVSDLADHSPDVIFLTVKANALTLISSAIELFYRDGMYVVSWQNGIDTELVIAEALGKKAVMRAVVNFGSSLLAPAHVHMSFHHPPHYIQELDPATRDAAITISELLTGCGLATDHTDQIIPMIWRKSIVNACSNSVSAITGRTVAETLDDPIVFQTVDAVAKECIKVARANEIFLGWDYYVECMEYMKQAGDHKPSMLIDMEMKRRTEVDFMNGKIIEYGERAGVDTPYNSAVWSLVKGMETR